MEVVGDVSSELGGDGEREEEDGEGEVVELLEGGRGGGVGSH